eukprot:Gb_02911 [translate_table: standard]
MRIHLFFRRYLFSSIINTRDPCLELGSFTIKNQRHKEDLVSNDNCGKNVITLCEQGRLKEALDTLHKMDHLRIRVDSKTYTCILQGCAKMEALKEGKHIHARIIKSGSEHDIFIGNNLVNMYVKCGFMVDAFQVFDKIPKRNVVSWTAMIAGYTQSGHGEEALKLFYQMRDNGVMPNHFTFASVVKACASLGALEKGKQVHYYIIESGFESDVVVRSALVYMYAKCGSIEDARHVFDKMSERTVVSWNTMIAGYAQNGNLEEARKLFGQVPKADVVSWTAIIAGYAQNGQGDEALKLFRQMQTRNLKPDRFILATVLSVCANLAALAQGRQFHAYIIESGFELDVVVGSALVDMYAKSGSIEGAHVVFDKMFYRNVVSWNAIITGCAQHGQGKEALQLFERMLQVGIRPNEISFIGVLSACGHAGLVDEGRRYFNSMRRDHGVIPEVEHYTCMVDLLGRAGCLDEAENFIDGMVAEPDATIWGALLGACRIHGHVDLAKRAAECLLDLKVHVAGIYVLLSNIYAAAGRWDDSANVRKLMKDRGVKKQPGCSWIEVKNRMHTFVAGDESHPQQKEIYELLEKLSRQMKQTGYVPDKNFVLHDMEEEQKELSLCHHSEKLAIAFGLINTNPRTTIRVVKNLRMPTGFIILRMDAVLVGIIGDSWNMSKKCKTVFTLHGLQSEMRMARSKLQSGDSKTISVQVSLRVSPVEALCCYEHLITITWFQFGAHPPLELDFTYRIKDIMKEAEDI